MVSTSSRRFWKLVRMLEDMLGEGPSILKKTTCKYFVDKDQVEHMKSYADVVYKGVREEWNFFCTNAFFPCFGGATCIPSTIHFGK
jgi:hypothetical protein